MKKVIEAKLRHLELLLDANDQNKNLRIFTYIYVHLHVKFLY
jgi:hypothetical protein